MPIAEITAPVVREPVEIARLPAARGSLQAELRRAFVNGRIRDPASEDFRPRLRFDSRRPTDRPNWINGLIYCRWQLLSMAVLMSPLVAR